MPSWTSKSQVLTPRRLAQCPFACLGTPVEIFFWRVDVVAGIQPPRISGWIAMKTCLVLGQSYVNTLIILTSFWVLMGISTFTSKELVIFYRSPLADWQWWPGKLLKMGLRRKFGDRNSHKQATNQWPLSDLTENMVSKGKYLQMTLFQVCE
jgi:hypothetical protein